MVKPVQLCIQNGSIRSLPERTDVPETDYQKALERIEEIFDSKIGTPESDEVDIL